MRNELEIDAYRRQEDLLIVLRGRLVLRHCQDVKARLGNLLNAQIVNVYLYLGELTFLDSAGLGLLVGVKMQANKNRTSLTFLSPNSRVEDIFRVSKLNTIFEIRGGPDAETIHAELIKDEYCLWRDGRDTQQSLNATEHGMQAPGLGNVSDMAQMPLRESMKSESGQRVLQLCNEAVEYLRQAEHPKAIEIYEQVLALDPENLSVLNNLGVVYEKKPEWYGKSMEIWKRLLDLSTRLKDDKHAARARKHIESLSKLTGSE
jgi:anti-sigma B factor antagonist